MSVKTARPTATRRTPAASRRTDSRLQEIAVHLAAAEPIEQHVDFHAGTGALGQRIGEGAADISRPVDIGLETDGLARTADRAEHVGKDFIPVAQRAHPIAFDDLRTEQHAHGSPELRVAGAVKTRHLPLDLLLARDQVHKHEGDGERPNASIHEPATHSARSPFVDQYAR